MKAPLILLVALLALPLPRALHPEEARTNRIAPIGRLPGHEERKTQAAAEPQAGESRALAPSEAITPPTPRTAKVSLGFVGMDFGDSLPGNTGFVPPDTHAAAGPNQIIETVNTAFSIYDRTNGTRLSGPNDLNAFFSVASTDVLSDPVVLYDEL